MNKAHLAKHVIRPVLEDMGAHSTEAEALLLMIAAHESMDGRYLHQVKGPAVGIYQMEPRTHDDIIQYLRKERHDLYDRLNKWTGIIHHSLMAGNLYYATFMARCFFLRFPEPLPETLREMAAYAKEKWNTVYGKATTEDYLNAYRNW